MAIFTKERGYSQHPEGVKAFASNYAKSYRQSFMGVWTGVMLGEEGKDE